VGNLCKPWERSKQLVDVTTDPAHRARRVLAALCLAAPPLGLLWVPWYAGGGPALAGVPFFYWYQFAWVPVSAFLLLVAYRLRPVPPRTAAPRGGTP